ncbi:hypothetical protein BPAE_0003g01660 [Botrytis paeoniae]|uniref:Uncharacterized protein n=1 Tax=Botrytis paeoniae TaxID=278948 RepID=A0A4Z1G610_9HELO|nr:hypothetical protein BPAE_0003g01660 [Botrytis paeoniae]
MYATNIIAASKFRKTWLWRQSSRLDSSVEAVTHYKMVSWLLIASVHLSLQSRREAKVYIESPESDSDIVELRDEAQILSTQEV